MSKQLVLEKRTEQGKKLKALRRNGQIPSVVYGGTEPVLTVSEYNVTEKALLDAGYHSSLELMIAGAPQLAIVKNIAIDPVSRRILSIEFQAISADEVVEATTQIKVTGFDGSEAAKLHYVILPVLEEVDVKAKPSDLPEELTVDGSGLSSTEDKLTLGDLKLPEGVELADKELELSTVIANVYDPAAEAAAREAEDAKADAGEAETKSEEDGAKSE